MKNKLITILAWSVLLFYLIIVSSFVNTKKQKNLCTAIKVNVIDSAENAFINQLDIKNFLIANKDQLVGKPLYNINKEEIEQLLLKKPMILKAEVFNTLSGVFRIKILQRDPILRVITKKGGYYLDIDGNKLPLSENYTSRTLVVTGNVKLDKLKDELLELSKFIINDEFWNAQINQIHVAKNKDYILIPRVGDQTIRFGGIDNYERKFQKLLALYRDGFEKVGWNKYTNIDLRYHNQVVCTKRK